jgi:polyribonucleotide nucleotidyltransferase
MDIKIEGINEQIMEIALEQALHARLHILGQMNSVISTAREVTSADAPSMVTLKVDSDKIRDIIGKGGVTIRAITEESGATVDIDDDGTVKIFGQNQAARDRAVEMVMEITAEAEVGQVYEGTVARIVDFGAFVTILPGKDGLVHISQIANQRVEKVTDFLEEGQTVRVKVLDVDQRGRIKLSIKELLEDEAETAEEEVSDAPAEVVEASTAEETVAVDSTEEAPAEVDETPAADESEEPKA